MISVRRGYNSEAVTHRHSVFPSGFGTGLMYGGLCFVAVFIPGMYLARGPLGRAVGHRAAKVGVKTLALVAAGTIGTRCAHKQKTLDELKLFGAYISPTEPSPKKDSLCQHPIIVRAMKEQREQRGYNSGPYGS